MCGEYEKRRLVGEDEEMELKVASVDLLQYLKHAFRVFQVYMNKLSLRNMIPTVYNEYLLYSNNCISPPPLLTDH